MSLPRFFRWLPLAVLGSVSGCSVSPVTRAALNADIDTLQREIDRADRRGELDQEAVKELALAIARRELRSALGDSGVDRVRQLRTCVGPLEGDLDDLADGDDAAAAAAAMALLEAGRGDGDDWLEEYVDAPQAYWRAVAARAAVSERHVKIRQQLVVDGDVRVRRGALHAALQGPESEERPTLVEAARLDPDPLSRSLAVRALGVLGGEAAVSDLRDLWGSAEAETRQVIVGAWASERSYSAGGEAQILSVLDNETGLVSIVAASQLIRKSSAHSGQALAHLKRAIIEGPTDEQRLAIQLVPSDPELLAAIAQQTDAASGAEEQTQVMAAARLLRRENQDEASKKLGLERLGKLLLSDSDLTRRQARAALISVRHQSVVPSLKNSLNSPSTAARRQAGEGLFLLGEHADAARVLGDRRGAVRVRVACTILVHG